MQTTIDSFIEQKQSVGHPGECETQKKCTCSPRPLAFKRARETSVTADRSRTRDAATYEVFDTSATPVALRRKLAEFGDRVTSQFLASELVLCLARGCGETRPNFTKFAGSDIPPVGTGSVSTIAEPMESIIPDSRSEFVIAHQRSTLSLLAVDTLLQQSSKQDDGNGTTAEEPVLRLASQIIAGRVHATSTSQFGFSCFTFLGSSLTALCGYQRCGKAEIFDLECVDEELCDPVHSFSIAAVERPSGTSLFAQPVCSPFVTCASSISSSTVLAGLSNGECVWLDSRHRKPVLCTQAGRAGVHGGARSISERVIRGGLSCVTAVSPTPNGRNLVVGSKDGLIMQYDSRRTQTPVAVFQLPSSICTIQPTFEGQSTGSFPVWANDYAGNILGVLCGPDGFTEIGKSCTVDAQRDESTIHFPPPRLSIVEYANTLVYPHISSNSLMTFNIEKVVDQSFTHEEDECLFSMDVNAESRNVSARVVKPTEFHYANTLLHRQSNASRGEATHKKPVVTDYSMLPTSVLECSDFGDQLSCCTALNRHTALLLGSASGLTAVLW